MKNLEAIEGALENVLLNLEHSPGTIDSKLVLIARAITLTGQAICAASSRKVELPRLNTVAGVAVPQASAVPTPSTSPPPEAATRREPFTEPVTRREIPLEEALDMVEGGPRTASQYHPTTPRKGRPVLWTSKFPPTYKQRGLLKHLAETASLSLAQMDGLAIEAARAIGGADAKFVTGWYAMSGKVCSRVIDMIKQNSAEAPQVAIEEDVAF
jgi:hypothetical protein